MATILFFGRLSESSDAINGALPDYVQTTDDVIAWLSERDDGLKAALATPGNRIAVNKTIISKSMPVSDADEIAFMSPLSGG